jgi:hypothetical protein
VSALVSAEGDFLADGFQDAFGVGEDVVVPEAEDAVAVGFDDLLARASMARSCWPPSS